MGTFLGQFLQSTECAQLVSMEVRSLVLFTYEIEASALWILLTQLFDSHAPNNTLKCTWALVIVQLHRESTLLESARWFSI